MNSCGCGEHRDKGQTQSAEATEPWREVCRFCRCDPVWLPEDSDFYLVLDGERNPSVSKADRGVQGGRVRRSRTFSVP